MTLTIRSATRNDIPQLSQSGPHIYRKHFGHLWHSTSELDTYLAAEYSESVLAAGLSDPSHCWFVAYTDSLIGFAKMTWESRIANTHQSGVLLNKLYLDPQTTGKQYGKIMFNDLVKQAQARGQSFFWLEVLEHNPRARKLYENQGMRHIKDSVFTTELQQSTLHIMGMSI